MNGDDGDADAGALHLRYGSGPCIARCVRFGYAEPVTFARSCGVVARTYAGAVRDYVEQLQPERPVCDRVGWGYLAAVRWHLLARSAAAGGFARRAAAVPVTA